MCITEYNEAETMQMFKEEGREEGRKEGEEERKALEEENARLRAQLAEAGIAVAEKQD